MNSAIISSSTNGISSLSGSLSLVDSTVRHNAGNGMYVSSGLTLTGATISDNGGTGVFINGNGAMLLAYNDITNNVGYGVMINGNGATLAANDITGSTLNPIWIGTANVSSTQLEPGNFFSGNGEDVVEIGAGVLYGRMYGRGGWLSTSHTSGVSLSPPEQPDFAGWGSVALP